MFKENAAISKTALFWWKEKDQGPCEEGEQRLGLMMITCILTHSKSKTKRTRLALQHQSHNVKVSNTSTLDIPICKCQSYLTLLWKFKNWSA